jgi:hypothetical protein
MSGVANRITTAGRSTSSSVSRDRTGAATRWPGGRARGLHHAGAEGTMAGKNRKGGSSGSQQTGQGNKQGGANKGKSATSGKGGK